MSQPQTKLWPEHVAHLQAEGFTDTHIAQLLTWGVRSLSVTEAQARGIKCRNKDDQLVSSSGIWFPFTRNFGQLRCDISITRDSGKPAKYLTPIGTASAAWTPPGVKVFTEGFKDAAAGTLMGGIPTGAIAGVSHWQKALKPLQLSNKVLLYDADAATNPNVFTQLIHAGVTLGWKVQLIPPIDGQPKAGLCEYFQAGHTPADYQTLIATALSPEVFLLALPEHWTQLPSEKLHTCLIKVLELSATIGLNSEDEEQLHRQLAQLPGQNLPAIQKQAHSIPSLIPLPVHKLFSFMEAEYGDRLRLNVLTQKIELDGQRCAIDRLYLQLANNHHIKALKDPTKDIATEIAERREYNPVLDYLHSVTKQEPICLDNLATRYLGTTAPIYNIYLKRTLIAAVARPFAPGCKHDTALILQGRQGLGKTTFFEILFGDWFDASMTSDISNKDNQMILHRCWCQEWGELEYITNTRYAAEVKRFLSHRCDLFRMPYGVYTEDFPRRGIIVGSTNKAEFLNDPTGNRRFWVIPVKVNKIDFEQLRAERDGIWAAAVQAYQQGEPWYLNAEEETQSQVISESFRSEDPWTETILEFIQGKDWVTIRDLLINPLGLLEGQINASVQRRVADILGNLGWKATQGRINGKKKRYWIPVPDHPHPGALEDQEDGAPSSAFQETITAPPSHLSQPSSNPAPSPQDSTNTPTSNPLTTRSDLNGTDGTPKLDPTAHQDQSLPPLILQSHGTIPKSGTAAWDNHESNHRCGGLTRWPLLKLPISPPTLDVATSSCSKLISRLNP